MTKPILNPFTGQLQLINSGSGSGTVVGPSTSTVGDIATWNNTTGTLLADSGVKFPIPLASGGTGADLTASNGGIFYSNATTGAILSGTATAGQMLQSGSSTTPAWSTNTWPATDTTGDLLYASGTNTIAGLAVGSTNQVLVVASGVPSWGDGWKRYVKLSKVSAPGATSVAFTSFVNSAYSYYVLSMRAVNTANNAAALTLQFSTNNGSSYLNSGYAWSNWFNNSSGSNGTNHNASDTSVNLPNAIGNATGAVVNLDIQLWNLNSASLYPQISYSVGTQWDSSATAKSNVISGAGGIPSANQVTAFQIASSSGNLQGTFTLYGVIEA